MVARDRALLSHAEPGDRRDRLATAFLDRHRLRVRRLISRPDCRWRTALPGVLLPRGADYDRAVHFHLHHDVGDRRPPRGIPTVCIGGADQPDGDRPGQSVGRATTSHNSGIFFSLFPSVNRYHFPSVWFWGGVFLPPVVLFSPP